MFVCLLSSAERSVHSDVRGALGRCSWLRLQAPGSDASVSQLPNVYGLMAGTDGDTRIKYTPFCNNEDSKKKKTQDDKVNKTNPRVNLLGPLIAVLKENCKA